MAADGLRRARLSPFEGRPLFTSVAFVTVGVLPLYLSSAQIVSLENAIGFDAARLGVAIALYFGLAAAVAQPVGTAVGRIGARRGLQFGATLSLLGSLIAASAGVWWQVLGAVAVAGFANAFMQISTNVVLATAVVYHRQGLSFGAKQGAVPLASALAGALLPSVGVAVGWRWPYVVAAVLATLAIGLAPPVRDISAAASERGERARPTLSRALKLLAAGGACGGAAGNGLALFVVPSAVDVGASEAVAGTVLAVGSAMVFLVRIAAGTVADGLRSSGQREMASLLGIGAVACVGLAFADSVGWYLVAMPVALMGSWGWPGLAYFSVVRIHPEATARASGVLLAANLTGTLIGPLVVSQFADRGVYTAAWLFCGALSLGAAAFMLASWRAFRRV